MNFIPSPKRYFAIFEEHRIKDEIIELSRKYGKIGLDKEDINRIVGLIHVTEISFKDYKSGEKKFNTVVKEIINIFSTTNNVGQRKTKFPEFLAPIIVYKAFQIWKLRRKIK